jgi:hypothetical protein
MFLTINDQWVLKNVDQQEFAPLQAELVNTWTCGDEGYKEFHESWKTR